MEMDMQEPGEMCRRREEEHGLAQTEFKMQKKVFLHPAVSRIIISGRVINLSA